MTNLGTQMLSKDVTSFWSALLLLFVMLFLSLGYSFQSIAINTTRINKLTTTEDRIRQKTTEIARDPTAGNLEQLRQELTELTSNRDKQNDNIGYGDGTTLSFAECLLPLNPSCFHRNSSEQNNLWLAIASGALGVCLFLLRELRVQAVSGDNLRSNGGTFLSVICLLPTGMIVGLLTLYLLRGTKGMTLFPLTDTVQVENPYGIAFACTVASLFSDRIFLWLSKLMNGLPVAKSDKSLSSESLEHLGTAQVIDFSSTSSETGRPPKSISQGETLTSS
jgi:hypothetical protein